MLPASLSSPARPPHSLVYMAARTTTSAHQRSWYCPQVTSHYTEDIKSEFLVLTSRPKWPDSKSSLTSPCLPCPCEFSSNHTICLCVLWIHQCCPVLGPYTFYSLWLERFYLGCHMSGVFGSFKNNPSITCPEKFLLMEVSPPTMLYQSTLSSASSLLPLACLSIFSGALPTSRHLPECKHYTYEALANCLIPASQFILNTQNVSNKHWVQIWAGTFQIIPTSAAFPFTAELSHSYMEDRLKQ